MEIRETVFLNNQYRVIWTNFKSMAVTTSGMDNIPVGAPPTGEEFR